MKIILKLSKCRLNLISENYVEHPLPYKCADQSHELNSDTTHSITLFDSCSHLLTFHANISVHLITFFILKHHPRAKRTQIVEARPCYSKQISFMNDTA